MLLSGGSFLSWNHVSGRDRSIGNTNCMYFGRDTRQNRMHTFPPSTKFSVLHVVSVVIGEQKSEPCEPRGTVEFQPGSLTDDWSYKEKFKVRSYEVGIKKTATIETIANLLQEASWNHYKIVGFSTDGFGTTLQTKNLNLIWVMSRLHIEINKYPAWNDVVEIETWYRCNGKSGIIRDLLLKSSDTGEVIGRATWLGEKYILLNTFDTFNLFFFFGPFAILIDFFSKYLMINRDTRRLQIVTDDIREEIQMLTPKSPKFAFPEMSNPNQKKIANLDGPVHYSKLGLTPRRVEMDMNQHVNNVTYTGWILESMPRDIDDSYELQTITLDFRRECKYGDVVDALTSRDFIMDDDDTISEIHGTATHANEYIQFLHSIKLSGDGSEITKGCTKWRKNTCI